MFLIFEILYYLRKDNKHAEICQWFWSKKNKQFHLISLAGFFYIYIKRMQKQDFQLL